VKDYLELLHKLHVAARFTKLVLYGGQKCFINDIPDGLMKNLVLYSFIYLLKKNTKVGV
jgi:hypothetical protein